MTPLQKAEKELMEFLKANPKGLKLQKKIEALLDASGSPDNRIETLKFLIQKEISKLDGIAEMIKVLDDASR